MAKFVKLLNFISLDNKKSAGTHDVGKNPCVAHKGNALLPSQKAFCCRYTSASMNKQ